MIERLLIRLFKLAMLPLLMVGSAFAALEEMDDADLSNLTGQDGVSIDITTDMNNFSAGLYDTDGTPTVSTPAFIGFRNMSMNASISAKFDVGGASATDTGFGAAHATFVLDMDDTDILQLGALTIAANTDGTGAGAELADFNIQNVTISPIVFDLYLGTEPNNNMLTVSSGNLTWWEGQVRLRDTDGYLADLGDGNGAGGTAGVLGFDVFIGSNGGTDAVDFTGMNGNITADGFVVNIPSITNGPDWAFDIFMGNSANSAVFVQAGDVSIAATSITIGGKPINNGLDIELDLGNVDMGYFQWVDDEGDASDTSPYNAAYDLGYVPTGVRDTDCAAAASRCGAGRFDNVELTGDLALQMDVAMDGGVPRLRTRIDLTGFSARVELVNGFIPTGGAAPAAGTDPGSWGQELRFANFQNARMDLEMRFESDSDQNSIGDGAATGVTIFGSIPDDFSFDIEYKDDPSGGFDENRLRLVGISPVGTELTFDGMTVDFDQNKGVIIDFPTITGSFEIGSLGASGGGIIMNGQTAGRILFEDMSFDPGRMTIKPN